MSTKKTSRLFTALWCMVLSVLLLPGTLQSATVGKLAGKVTDQSTGEPIIGANVIIQGTSLGAATDVDGDFFYHQYPAW